MNFLQKMKMKLLKLKLIKINTLFNLFFDKKKNAINILKKDILLRTEQETQFLVEKISKV